jgi:hypothetical protein
VVRSSEGAEWASIQFAPNSLMLGDSCLQVIREERGVVDVVGDGLLDSVVEHGSWRPATTCGPG